LSFDVRRLPDRHTDLLGPTLPPGVGGIIGVISGLFFMGVAAAQGRSEHRLARHIAAVSPRLFSPYVILLPPLVPVATTALLVATFPPLGERRLG
jgi:hypothetical protein